MFDQNIRCADAVYCHATFPPSHEGVAVRKVAAGDMIYPLIPRSLKVALKDNVEYVIRGVKANIGDWWQLRADRLPVDSSHPLHRLMVHMLKQTIPIFGRFQIQRPYQRSELTKEMRGRYVSDCEMM